MPHVSLRFARSSGPDPIFGFSGRFNRLIRPGHPGQAGQAPVCQRLGLVCCGTAGAASNAPFPLKVHQECWSRAHFWVFGPVQPPQPPWPPSAGRRPFGRFGVRRVASVVAGRFGGFFGPGALLAPSALDGVLGKNLSLPFSHLSTGAFAGLVRQARAAISAAFAVSPARAAPRVGGFPWASGPFGTLGP